MAMSPLHLPSRPPPHQALPLKVQLELLERLAKQRLTHARTAEDMEVREKKNLMTPD